MTPALFSVSDVSGKISVSLLLSIIAKAGNAMNCHAFLSYSVIKPLFSPFLYY